jgi:hypothetical protein
VLITLFVRPVAESAADRDQAVATQPVPPLSGPPEPIVAR